MPIDKIKPSMEILPEETILHITSFIPFQFFKKTAQVNASLDRCIHTATQQLAKTNRDVKDKLTLSLQNSFNQNNVKSIQTAIIKGADINTEITYQEKEEAQTTEIKGTIVSFATKIVCTSSDNSQMDRLDFLLAHGANLDIFDSENESPLMIAIRLERLDIARQLIRAGATIDIANKDGFTAFHMAAYVGIDYVKLLYEEKQKQGQCINIHKQGKDNGFTLLHAAVEGDQIEVVQFLLGLNCDTSITNSKGQTALQLAEEKGLHHIVELLPTSPLTIKF
ncbi:ankyrin repeat domain-containing protein [Legionella israelensis]|uniref:Ankyrin repeat domain-containing protein n=1 Tax=Legionella israelensis TaxID=454 RepID=A0AAX1ECR1_9GAMM|nr:ankyrin repeat domain-containing protein [Legionella israelensis]QBR82896.1 ankyrin repeat domain-containing protein [Legionella israelensis]